MTLQGGGDSILAKWNYSGSQIELEDETDTLLENGGLSQSFFIFCFTDFFGNKLVSEDEIKIKIEFIRTIFQLN